MCFSDKTFGWKIPKRQLLHSRANTSCGCFRRRAAFSFERLLWEHLHENIWEWQEIRHLSAWRATNVFQVLQRDEHEYWALQPPNPRQNLWSPAASGSHYPCHLSNKLLYWAHSWGWCCLSPGIITIILCFHNVSTGLLKFLVTILLAWCDLSEATEEDFQTIDARYSTLASFCYISQKVLVQNYNHRARHEWRNPPLIWEGIPVPV